MPTDYPSSLPPPSGFSFTALERRAAEGTDGPFRARARARDVVVSAPGVRWVYSSAELAIWRAWYETELLWGQRRFLMPLPGDQGEQLRLARFVGPAARRHLSAGIFEVTADIEYRLGELGSSVPVPAPVIGWLNPIGSSSGTAARTNTGTASSSLDNYPQTKYAGVVGYTAGDVVWSSTWAPTLAGPAPTLTPLAGGVLAVSWPRQAFDAWEPTQGLLTVTATVDGVSVGVGQGLVMSGSGSYTTLAWGPQP